jgi:thiamine biosynthesis lipoprotein
VGGPAGDVTLALGRGGLATSGVDRRRWRRGGREAHHVIDPRTGAPAATDLVRATAVGATAAEAEAFATALLVAGERGARRLARRLGVPAVLVTADGRMALEGGLA